MCYVLYMYISLNYTMTNVHLTAAVVNMYLKGKYTCIV